MNNEIGKRIKHLREKHNVTQKDLAHGANIERGNISHYEKGDWNPNYETTKKIALYFKVDPDWLYYGNDKKFINDNVPYLSDESIPLQGRTVRILGELSENEINIIKLYRMLDERDKIKVEGIIEEKIKEINTSKKGRKDEGLIKKGGLSTSAHDEEAACTSENRRMA